MSQLTSIASVHINIREMMKKRFVNVVNVYSDIWCRSGVGYQLLSGISTAGNVPVRK